MFTGLRNARALCGIVASLIVGFAGNAFDQVYPSKPIRLVVPFAPGGGIVDTDAMAKSSPYGIRAAGDDAIRCHRWAEIARDFHSPRRE